MTIARVAAGLAVVGLGTATFVDLADAATEGDELAAFDPQLTATFVDHRIAELTPVARAITFLGDIPVLTGLTIVIALLIRARTQRWRPAIILAVGMLGAAVLTFGLKVLIARQRPDFSIVIGTVSTGFSFPSGHSLSATVFFLLLAALFWQSTARRAVKLTAVAAAVLLSLAVGLSRIYLGYHWATDVLAGWTLALTWLALLATVLTFLDRSKASQGAAERVKAE